MDTKTFHRFRRIVHENSGIWLRDGKETMVCARVSKRMRALGITDYESYLRRIVDDDSGEEVAGLLDAISTNVTSFFREEKHFFFLEKAMAEWLEQGQRRFRFWSAACSSGEEPYSMAMTVLEAGKGFITDMRILATDISRVVLDKCQEGIYAEEKLQHVSPFLKEKYFHRDIQDPEVSYRTKKSLKSPIVFRRMNLSHPPFPMRGPLDAIFCRNVLMYFDEEVRTRVLCALYDLLKPGGYLMVGHAESLTGLGTHFKVVMPSVYVKKGPAKHAVLDPLVADIQQPLVCPSEA